MPRIAFITPPLIKPAEPGLSSAAAAQWFRQRGVDALSIDASMGWYRHALRPAPLAQALEAATTQGYAKGSLMTFRQVVKAAEAPEPVLRRSATYRDRHVYSSAVNQLVNALRLTSIAHPGFHLRVADVEAEGKRPHRSEDLAVIAAAPTPFDAYFTEELIPQIEREGITHVALSFTFLHQAYAGFRLAHLLEARLPQVQRLAGGPLIACWHAVGTAFDAPVFRRFHHVSPTSSEAEMAALAIALGGRDQAPRIVLAPDLDQTPWHDYLVPVPTIPAALGRGCYWRRCTFCPDYLHPSYHACGQATVETWLESVAKRFPSGAMLHLTDSALSPPLLARVAEVIRQRQLPLRWHGFVRLEARFAKAGFMEQLAQGGCTMLQWGLETASPRLLELMDKGVTPDQARQVLRASAQAGILNHAYLLFGLPTETDEDREQTLDFVREEAASLHDLNASILNLPKRSPMHDHPNRYGISAITPFGHETDLSLYSDFRCGTAHPRLEARHWIAGRLLKDPTVKRILGDLNAPFKANHSCFLPTRS